MDAIFYICAEKVLYHRPLATSDFPKHDNFQVHRHAGVTQGGNRTWLSKQERFQQSGKTIYKLNN